ncbi:MAG: hypothetical protein HQL63_00760 [Magnetococcales bacterium]|nr:hypothetical protein [Magnetococcales bacterium]MBF0322369.1 hypothetical protein [Magnetococcales bacterium]
MFCEPTDRDEEEVCACLDSRIGSRFSGAAATRPSGVSVARVGYTILARSWSLTTPKHVAGLDAYPIQLRITGTAGNLASDGEIICQRGDGEFRGDDISDPLLATTDAKISRGRAEIDAGGDLQEVSLTCIHRPGILPGHLVEIHDALMGQSWRGKVTSVSHDATGPRITTSLEILRHVPTIA